MFSVTLAFRRGWSMQWPRTGWVDLVFLFACVVAAFGLYRLAVAGICVGRRWAQARPFWRVAGAAGLNWLERWRLLCLARREGVSTPLTFMISSEALRHHARRYEQGLGSGRAARWERSMQRISGKLFGMTRDGANKKGRE